MSTNSTIAIKVGNQVTSVYCHWDGYLEWNGRILYNLYNNEYKAEDLVKMGNISSLRGTIEESSFYKRDNGQMHEEARIMSFEEYLEKVAVQEFNYLYDVATRQWYVMQDDWCYLTEKNNNRSIQKIEI